MTLDVTYWLDAASKLVASVMAETEFFAIVGAFGLFVLSLFVWLYWSQS